MKTKELLDYLRFMERFARDELRKAEVESYSDKVVSYQEGYLAGIQRAIAVAEDLASGKAR